LPSNQQATPRTPILFQAGIFKENAKYPVWTCSDTISLILGTRFSLILETQWQFFDSRDPIFSDSRDPMAIF